MAVVTILRHNNIGVRRTTVVRKFRQKTTNAKKTTGQRRKTSVNAVKVKIRRTSRKNIRGGTPKKTRAVTKTTTRNRRGVVTRLIKRRPGRPRQTGAEADAKRCRRRVVGKSIRMYKDSVLRFSKGRQNPQGHSVRSRKQAIAIGLAYSRKICTRKRS